MTNSLAKQIATSPVGMRLLERLEYAGIGKLRPYRTGVPLTRRSFVPQFRFFDKLRRDRKNDLPDIGLPDIGQAINYIESTQYSDIIYHIDDSVDDTSPLNPYPPPFLPVSTYMFERRILLAEKVIENYFADLTANFELDSQEIWKSQDKVPTSDQTDSITDTDFVYGEGEFTWASERSITTPDTLTHLDWILSYMGSPDEFICYKPLVNKKPTVYEIHSFDDWHQLIENNPRVPSNSTKPCTPDWGKIANKYDAVHLSWMGIILAHDNLELANRHNVIPLRYWKNEQTHWTRSAIIGYNKIGTYSERSKLYSDREPYERLSQS